MSTITINDLPTDRALDRKAMSSIRGASGAPWIYGWISAYAPAAAGLVPVVNFYQVNNSFYADKVINQSQTVNINNSGANSNINAVPLSSLTA